jgi:hypothetical protein
VFRCRSIVWCRQVVVGNEPLFERLAAAKFDLAVIDGMFLQKCVYLIAHRLGLPVVTYADAIDPLVVRVPWLSSFVPVIFTPFTDRMSFVERLKNTAMMLALSFFSPIPDSPMEVKTFAIGHVLCTFCFVSVEDNLMSTCYCVTIHRVAAIGLVCEFFLRKLIPTMNCTHYIYIYCWAPLYNQLQPSLTC